MKKLHGTENIVTHSIKVGYPALHTCSAIKLSAKCPLSLASLPSLLLDDFLVGKLVSLLRAHAWVEDRGCDHQEVH